MFELLDEFSKRCRRLIESRGENAHPTLNSLRYYVTSSLTIELAYGVTGKEFFDVLVPNQYAGIRIYREINGEIVSSIPPAPMLLSLVEHLRQIMILDDLADV